MRLEGSIRSNSKEAVNSVSFTISNFLKSKYFKILILIIIISLLAISAPKIIDSLTPYKDVDSSYIANPVPFEKVRFTGEYVGESDSSMVIWGYIEATYDVVKVDDQYVFIRENNLDMNLNKGDIVQLEGKFSDGGKIGKELDHKQISGYWFAPYDYKIVR